MARSWRLVRKGRSLFVTEDTASVRNWEFQAANSDVQKERATVSPHTYYYRLAVGPVGEQPQQVADGTALLDGGEHSVAQ